MARTERFQSTLPTRGSDVRFPCAALPADKISIHAPHEGERQRYGWRAVCALHISIHAPHEGERPLGAVRNIPLPKYFNPRSPRGGATLYPRAG